MCYVQQAFPCTSVHECCVVLVVVDLLPTTHTGCIIENRACFPINVFNQCSFILYKIQSVHTCKTYLTPVRCQCILFREETLRIG